MENHEPKSGIFKRYRELTTSNKIAVWGVFAASICAITAIISVLDSPAPGNNHKVANENLNQTSKPSQKLLNRLLEQLDRKDVDISERDKIIEEWIKKYKELEQRLSQRAPDEKLALQAREQLANGNLDKAEELLQRSLEQNLKIAYEQNKKAAADAYELGSIKELKIEYREAQKYYLKATQLAPNNTLYLNDYGSILHDLGEYKKAIEFYEKALKSNINTFGKDHPKVAIRWNNIGAAWQALGEYKKAIEFFDLALKNNINTFGKDHPKVAIRWNNIGAAWKALGEHKKAIKFFDLALNSDINTFSKDHPKVAIRWKNIGMAWRALGEYKKAIEFYEMSLKVFRARLGDGHPSTKTVMDNLELVRMEMK